MVAAAVAPTFDYDFATINNLRVQTAVDPKNGKNIVRSVIVNDEPLQATERFWTSLFARFGFNQTFFKYFDYHEVFDRITKVESSDRLRLCIERSKDKNGVPTNRLLAVSNPAKPIVPHEDLMGMLETFGHEGVAYSNGIIESTHRPRVGSAKFDILGDAFENRFVMATPVDGYGKPNVYLSLLRQICSNGVVAMSKAFRSEVSIGQRDDNVAFALTRVLDQFSNEEGYAALRQRIESAGKSWASVSESNSLYKMLVRLHNTKDDDGRPMVGGDGASLEASPYLRELIAKDTVGSPMGEDETLQGSPIIRAYHAMTGDASRLYGLANLNALSDKRQRALPVRCTVYDMLNFATEVSTHHTPANGSRKLQGWVGSLISGEYDMEGTCDKFTDFADFHISSKFQNNLTGSEYSVN